MTLMWKIIFVVKSTQLETITIKSFLHVFRFVEFFGYDGHLNVEYNVRIIVDMSFIVS
jgi:hypothetical protein